MRAPPISPAAPGVVRVTIEVKLTIKAAGRTIRALRVVEKRAGASVEKPPGG